jgi:hypothetical protein
MEVALDEARRYTDKQIEELRLTADHLVVEVGSNDGYLLQYFVARGIPVLGIEASFFTEERARGLRAEGLRADLLIANHVLDKVSDVQILVAAMKVVLAPRGVITVEFAHVLPSVAGAPAPYSSLLGVTPLFARNRLTIYDVDEVGGDEEAHGGSLRVFASHSEDPLRPITPRIGSVTARERTAGLEAADP